MMYDLMLAALFLGGVWFLVDCVRRLRGRRLKGLVIMD